MLNELDQLYTQTVFGCNAEAKKTFHTVIKHKMWIFLGGAVASAIGAYLALVGPLPMSGPWRVYYQTVYLILTIGIPPVGVLCGIVAIVQARCLGIVLVQAAAGLTCVLNVLIPMWT